jgi:DNA-binding MarR family transcriptional regulator
MVAGIEDVITAIAEIPDRGWTLTRALSRSCSLQALHRRLDVAARQGWIEREDANPGGVRRIWRVRLTDAGASILRSHGFM